MKNYINNLTILLLAVAVLVLAVNGHSLSKEVRQQRIELKAVANSMNLNNENFEKAINQVAGYTVMTNSL